MRTSGAHLTEPHPHRHWRSHEQRSTPVQSPIRRRGLSIVRSSSFEFLTPTREAVFAAWTDADAFCQWFGPDGFTCTVREMDVRPGGRARFDMASGDGTVFTNRFDYLEVVPVERLVLDHGSDADDDPARFRVTIVLDEQADGKTVLTLRQLHPTVERRDCSHRLRRGRARSADDAEARSPSRGRLNPRPMRSRRGTGRPV